MDFDLAVFRAINGLVGAGKILDIFGVFAAKYLGPFLFLGAAAIVFFNKDSFRKKFHGAALVALSLILSRGIFTEIIRFFFDRPRPFESGEVFQLIEHSFGGALPSGHAAFYFALAFAIMLLNRKWGWVFISGAFLIGLGRVFVGVHWPLDVIAGILVAALSVFIVRKLLPSNRF